MHRVTRKKGFKRNRKGKMTRRLNRTKRRTIRKNKRKTRKLQKGGGVEKEINNLFDEFIKNYKIQKNGKEIDFNMKDKDIHELVYQTLTLMMIKWEQNKFSTLKKKLLSDPQLKDYYHFFDKNSQLEEYEFFIFKGINKGINKELDLYKIESPKITFSKAIFDSFYGVYITTVLRKEKNYPLVKGVEKYIGEIKKKQQELLVDNSIDQLKKFIYLLYFTCNSMNKYLYQQNQVYSQIDMFIHTFCNILIKNLNNLKVIDLKTNEENTLKKLNESVKINPSFNESPTILTKESDESYTLGTEIGETTPGPLNVRPKEKFETAPAEPETATETAQAEPETAEPEPETATETAPAEPETETAILSKSLEDYGFGETTSDPLVEYEFFGFGDEANDTDDDE